MDLNKNTLKLNISKVTVSSLPVNSLILGCIDDVKDYQLNMCLPSGIHAKVNITNISKKYSSLLSDYAEHTENTKCPHKPCAMFKVGQCLPVKILSKTDSSIINDHSSLTYVTINASIKPDDINQEINRSALFFHAPSFTISASVNSVEEHGYIMDVGLEGLSGFLSNEDAKAFLKSNEQSKLVEGQVLFCNVLSASKKVIKLTTKLSKKDNFLENAFEIPISCLLPGLKVKAVVVDITNVGLEVIIFNNFQGFVHKDYLSSIWDLPKKDYKIGQTIFGIILYVNPFTQVISLTMREKLDPFSMKKHWSGLNVGKVFEKAVVLGKDDKNNFIFKLTNELKGFAPKSELSDDFLAAEDLALFESKMPIGSEQKCRIISIMYLDGMVKVTLKPSLLKETDVSIESLEIGSIINGTVLKCTEKGLTVKLGLLLKAFCPILHLTENPHLLKAEKQFPLGKSIKCRVLHLEKTFAKPKIIVTCRKPLMDLKLKILYDIKKASQGFETKGIVVAVRKNGLLIEFFNQLKGWLSSQQFDIYNIEFPESSYKIGQILTVMVVQSDVKTNQIFLELVSKNQEKLKWNKNIEVGTIIKNCVIESKKQNGFLINNGNDYSMFLPYYHLSDNPIFFNLLQNALSVGDIIDEVVVFKIQFETIIVSKKLVFIDEAQNQFALDQLETNAVIPAVVSTIKAYGIFLELPNHLTGLVPTKFLSDETLNSPEDSGYVTGQTLMACVKKIEQVGKNKKLLFSTKLSDVCKEIHSFSSKLLNFYLKELFWIIHLKSSNQLKLKKLTYGSVVNYKITQVFDEYLLCQVQVIGEKESVKGVIYLENDDLTQKFFVGSIGKAVVLHIDIDSLLVFLSKNERLLKNVQHLEKIDSFDQIRIGQTIASTIRYISKYFIIASLEASHALGTFAFIPNSFHLNSLTNFHNNNNNVFIGKKVKIVIEKKIETNYSNQPIYVIGKILHIKADLKQIHKEYRKEKLKEYKLKRKRTQKEMPISCKIRKHKNDNSIVKEIELKSDSDEDENIKNKILNVKSFSHFVKKPFTSLTKKTKMEEKSISKKKKKKLFKQLSLKQTNNIKMSCLSLDNLFDWNSDNQTLTFSHNDQEVLEETLYLTNIQTIQNENRQKNKNKNQEENNVPNYRKINEVILSDEPSSKEEFEELVKNCSNDSKNWLKYVQFYINQSEIDKAKEICYRALEMLSYREEEHKLRIWIKLLNIEYKHGNIDSFDQLFKQALKCNDELKIYHAMIKIYEDEKKYESVELLFKELIKKFSMNKQIWIEFGQFYMKRNFKDSFRKLYLRCINTLNKSDHIEISSKFAQLEFQFGDVERGKSLFESILIENPKRCDIWSVYLDMMIKYCINRANNCEKKTDIIESIRMLFERIISLRLKTRRMKFFFQKYIRFEKSYGDEQKVVDIKKKAQDYVENLNL